MGIRAKDLIEEIIRPVLKDINLYSLSVEKLIAGTIAQESLMGKYLVQNGGPAKGIIQMEPETHDDIHKNYLKYTINLKSNIIKSCGIQEIYNNRTPSSDFLIYNLRYCVCMCRAHYYRKSEALPDQDRIDEMARYWKDHYNTYLGKGKKTDFLENWDRYLSDYYSE